MTCLLFFWTSVAPQMGYAPLGEIKGLESITLALC